MSEATRKLDQLTTTRFLAALAVVFFHVGHKLGILGQFPILTAGPSAVGYFFVLSGFVMALVYYRPGVPFDLCSYLLARFSRIYPLYILSFALTCLHYLDILAKIKPPKIWANIFLYQAWIPDYALSFNIAAWSLSIEIFFYLLFPVLLIFIARWSAKQIIWFSAGFWVLSQVLHAVFTSGATPDTVDWLAYFPLVHLNAFLLGVAGGVWYRADSAKHIVNRTMNLIWLTLSLGTALLLLALRVYLPTFPQNFSLDAGLLAPLYLIIILTLAMDTSRLSKFLSHPWLVLLGDASYGLYILHVPLLWLYEDVLKFAGNPISFGLMYLIFVPAIIGLSVLVFKYIERPVQTWLRTNPQMLAKIVLDVILILAMTRLSFILRLGTEPSAYLRTQAFTLRVGVAVFFLALLAFGFYLRPSWRSLTFALITGTSLLGGFIYLAWTSGWVEGFPRSIILLIPLLVFAAIYSSRAILEFLQPKIRTETELS